LASSPLPALIKLNDEKALAAFGYGQGLAAQAGRGLVIEAQERFAVRAEVDAGPDLAVGQEGKGIEELGHGATAPVMLTLYHEGA